MRVDKLLANVNVGTRKEVHELIKKGLVTVNDEVVKKKDFSLNPEIDTVCVRGIPIETKLIYYIKLHKPAGYVTATEDPRHPTVMELLPPSLWKLGIAPVGRLDKDTEGLLLLTNDGVWAHRIINGKKEVEKSYFLTYTGTLSEEGLNRIREGMILGDGTALKPALWEPTGEQEGVLTIREGKFHQVKRMIGAAGGEVTYLKRLSVGDITLSGIENEEEWVELTEKEKKFF